MLSVPTLICTALSANLRGAPRPVAATVRRPPGPGGGRWLVTTEHPVWAAAPGQACVLYAADQPEVVLGGGRIARPEA